MSRSRYLPLICAAAALSLTAFSAQAAETCPAGYTMHPRLHSCVAKPTCGEGATLHPRLNLCVMAATCDPGSTWHRCVATKT